MRYAAGLLMAIGLLLTACSERSGEAAPDGAPAGQVTVFAAASLTDAFSALAESFEEENPGVSVTLHFASSSALRVQLEEGAPADVFASADTVQMAAAQEAGAVEGEPRLFARNRPVVVVPEDNPGRVVSVDDLARPGLKLVLAREDVPIGRYARQVIANLAADPFLGSEYEEAVLTNVVSEEANVRLVLAKVELGEADAAFVYSSDVASAGDRVRAVDIPDGANVLADYAVALAAGAGNRGAGAAFIEFLLSAQGQEVLREHGFLAPR